MKKLLFVTLISTSAAFPLIAFAGDFDPPSLVSVLASSSPGVLAVLNDFYPWAVLIISIIIGFGLIGWLIHHFGKALHHN